MAPTGLSLNFFIRSRAMKKLTLAKETLLSLTTEQTTHVQGGGYTAGVTCGSIYCSVNCPNTHVCPISNKGNCV